MLGAEIRAMYGIKTKATQAVRNPLAEGAPHNRTMERGNNNVDQHE
jgi:hypothetical protein